MPSRAQPRLSRLSSICWPNASWGLICGSKGSQAGPVCGMLALGGAALQWVGLWWRASATCCTFDHGTAQPLPPAACRAAPERHCSPRSGRLQPGGNSRAAAADLFIHNHGGALQVLGQPSHHLAAAAGHAGVEAECWSGLLPGQHAKHSIAQSAWSAEHACTASSDVHYGHALQAINHALTTVAH